MGQTSSQRAAPHKEGPAGRNMQNCHGKHRSYLEAVSTKLKDNHGEVRQVALQLVAQIADRGDKHVVALVKEALSDELSHVRQEAPSWESTGARINYRNDCKNPTRQQHIYE